MNRFGDIDCSFKRLPPAYGYRAEKLVSLEKALEPVQSQINELPHFIKIAKRYCRHPSEHDLSKDQSAAVYIYTMEWGETTLYRVLNKALRAENRQELKIWFPYLKLFDTALDLLPAFKGNLWRGVSANIGKTFVKDQQITWWSVNSCTSSVSVIKGFLGNQKNSTLFLIEAIDGRKVSGYTEFENENEVILRMGTKLRVNDDPLAQSNGSHIVHLIETNDDDNNNITTARSTMDVSAKPSKQGTSEQDKQKWKEHGITVAGGNGDGNQLNQLCNPHGIYVDDDNQCIYIADWRNDRIVEWKFGAKNGKIVAGGNGNGNRMDQLNRPTDVIVNKKNNSLIICDCENRRIVEWSRQNGTKEGQTIISNTDCWGITMDHNEDLYVSDYKKNEVRRWKRGQKVGFPVAGGNGQGGQLNQFDWPAYLFVDKDQSVYVTDNRYHRVMKWMKGAKEGMIVAGGHDEGNGLLQFSYPQGVIVDQWDNVYVADFYNSRIMCWSKGSKEGRVIVGGNGEGKLSNQLNCPRGISFDRQGHLYVIDECNHRVQKFEVDNAANDGCSIQ